MVSPARMIAQADGSYITVRKSDDRVVLVSRGFNGIDSSGRIALTVVS